MSTDGSINITVTKDGQDEQMHITGNRQLIMSFITAISHGGQGNMVISHGEQDEVQNETPWYTELWYEDDLSNALIQHKIPVNEMTIGVLKDHCRNLFDDKTDRSELICDMAHRVFIANKHERINDLSPEQFKKELTNAVHASPDGSIETLGKLMHMGCYNCHLYKQGCFQQTSDQTCYECAKDGNCVLYNSYKKYMFTSKA